MQCMLLTGDCRDRCLYIVGYSICRCSMMTVAQISLVSYLLGSHFLFAQMCPMTLAVCIFSLISTRKSIIYALLYISAILNEQIFSGGGLWMKKLNLCS